MVPADLTNPFKESCCDGGECNVGHQSARTCGCDPGANWVCQRHQHENEVARLKALLEQYEQEDK